MISTLQEVLDLVGTLDDTPGENSSRERFRNYLTRPTQTIGAVRDYIETCLRTSGPQYHRALQDLVNHTARLIGFEVNFGRYQGVQGAIGYDGIWRSGELAIVVEVKTTDVYTVRTATLVNYVDELISDHRVTDWDHALGLYVVGRAEAALTQFEIAILAERRTQQLRVITVESLLSIAELGQDDRISQDEAAVLLKPTSPFVDDIVRLLARVAATPPGDPRLPQTGDALRLTTTAAPSPTAEATSVESRAYWVTAVSDDQHTSAQEAIRTLLSAGWYVYGERTPGRKRLQVGDGLCFYESGVGIVATAEAASVPERKPLSIIRDAERYPWAFHVTNVRYFFDAPVVIDAPLRAQLDAFQGREPSQSWAWFVQATHAVTEHDFRLLTAQAAPTTSGVATRRLRAPRATRRSHGANNPSHPAGRGALSLRGSCHAQTPPSPWSPPRVASRTCTPARAGALQGVVLAGARGLNNPTPPAPRAGEPTRHPARWGRGDPITPWPVPC
jgi:hypothetical protein